MLTPIKVLALIMKLNGKRAKDYKTRAITILGRVFAGDQSLKAEINKYAQSNSPMQTLLREELGIPPQPAMTNEHHGPDVVDERRERIKRMRLENNQLEVENYFKNMKAMTEFLGIPMTDADRINGADLVRRANNQTRVPTQPIASSSSQLAVAVPVTSMEITAQAATLGAEISIPYVCSKYKLRLSSNRHGSVGKEMARLMRIRYGSDFVNPKRSAPFQGKIIQENAYWEKDEDLLVQAIETLLA